MTKHTHSLYWTLGHGALQAGATDLMRSELSCGIVKTEPPAGPMRIHRVAVRCVAWVALLLAAMFAPAHRASALVIASDDASQAAYSDGWQTGDNGGTGFNAWANIGNQSGSGFGGGFLSTGNGNVNIGSGGNNAAFGVFGNSGGVGQAFRPFAAGSTLQVGWTFSLDMDNQSIDNGGTVGFGLQNSSSQNLAELFFVGGDQNYKVNRSGGSVDTGVPFTSGGLHLSFTLTSANSFSMSVDQLSDGLGTNVSTVTGNLITQSGGESVAQLRVFNANGGPDVFFNNLVISVVPEVPAVLFGAMISGVLAIWFAIRAISRSEEAVGVARWCLFGKKLRGDSTAANEYNVG